MSCGGERRGFVLGAALAGAALASSVAAQQPIQRRMGDPVAGLSPSELARFAAGKAEFDHVLTNAEGLGPIMNDSSCSHCHGQPQSGGPGLKKVTRFGHTAQGGNPFDPLAALGGSLLQFQSIDKATCLEVVPPEADVTALRITTSTFGAGLLEAIADADIQFYVANPPPGVTGIAQMVNPLEDPPALRVGRYGWKAQQATVLSFSGDASLNEMGLTNRLVGTENAPNGNTGQLALCDAVSDPEDGPFPARIDRMTDFQRFLAPPPKTPRSGMTGETLFNTIGCAACHVSAPYVTQTVAEPALSNKTIQPYSDFLLHDMGSLGDGIVQGVGTEQEMKTAPLWGVGHRATLALLHDGTATGALPQDNLVAAIQAHDVEGAASRDAFGGLSSTNQQLVLDFLMSLGRLEFDQEADNDVDDLDWFFLENEGAFTGPLPSFTPDSPFAVADFDQDGDFDLKDFGILQRAMTGS